MKNIVKYVLLAGILSLIVPVQAQEVANAGALSSLKTLKVDRGLTAEGKKCISCHADKNPGIINDWKDSRHAHVGVSCIDCHQVDKDQPHAAQNCDGVKGTEIHVSVLVSPKTCGRCHPVEVEQFSKSGHFRARHQIENRNKDGMAKLMYHHEGQNHPEFSKSPDTTGCMQCHGSVIKLDANKRPTTDTWPTFGIGTIYPDGSTGSCVACHSRHKFSIAEARHPRACASCHLGPDHPDIEVFENSRHGQVFLAEGHKWKMDSAPDAWEPGDYRGPTCATCHLSGIGELSSTHNISERLKYNLWAKVSKVRNSPDPLSMWTGDGPAGREKMKKVCSNCHTSQHTTGFFAEADKHVELYNVAYWAPAKKMHDELSAKGLLKKNPWDDEFQKVFYHLWHHEGRRMRHGAAMGAPDWAHWHGSFECMQDLYKLQSIHKKRMETGKIEE